VRVAGLVLLCAGSLVVSAQAQREGEAAVDGGVPDASAPRDAGDASRDASVRSDGGERSPDAGPVERAALPPLPTITEPPTPPLPALARRAKPVRGKVAKPAGPETTLEHQNPLQAVARRYAQLLLSRRFDEAFLMHEEAGGRRPNWASLRGAASGFLDAHGVPTAIEQSIAMSIGAELTTFFFTARFRDGAELPLRVALDYWGHVSGAAVGSEIIPAMRQRYDRNDAYKTRTVLSLPFAGAWTASNATLGPGNGHYLNANQRFAVDFLISEPGEDGKRKTSRPPGKQNTDYFSFGQDILAPADAVVVQAVDGIPDNTPGQVDVYYRLGNTVVLSFENGEFAYLCHLMSGSVRVRAGDRVQRGQVVAKCGNSGNSTAPHLHFQLTDAPLITYSTSLPAYFQNVKRNGSVENHVLPQSGDRLENAQNSRIERRSGEKPRAGLGTSTPGKRRRQSG
jgi:murein DD-endopeptidase MepM/ murein hydrolase activator NlpD